jgi:hypothetical protein
MAVVHCKSESFDHLAIGALLLAFDFGMKGTMPQFLSRSKLKSSEYLYWIDEWFRPPRVNQNQ